MTKQRPVDDDAFGWWLAGLVDGEGMFGAYWARNKLKPTSLIVEFKLTFRDDERDLVQYIYEKLGVGRVLHHVRNGSSHPQSTFIVSSIPELHDVILPLFDKFRLQSRKRLDYEVFRRIVEMQYATYHRPKTREYKEIRAALVEQLRGVKQYEDR